MITQDMIDLASKITLPVAALIAVIVLYRDNQSYLHTLIDQNAAQIDALSKDIKALTDSIDAWLSTHK